MWADELIRIYVELREIHGDEMGREECWELAGIICRFKEQQREADLFAAEVMETLVALPTTGWGDLT